MHVCILSENTIVAIGSGNRVTGPPYPPDGDSNLPGSTAHGQAQLALICHPIATSDHLDKCLTFPLGLVFSQPLGQVTAAPEQVAAPIYQGS